MFIAAMLMVCEVKVESRTVFGASGALFLLLKKQTVATFSSGQRASSALMRKVLRFIYELPGGPQRVVGNAKELLAIAVPSMVQDNGQLKMTKQEILDSGKVNRLFAYPASAKGEPLLLPEAPEAPE